MSNSNERPVVQVDIVSDVVCPWCIVGFRQLDQALTRTGIAAQLQWHPFELNPDMPAQGQNLREHLMAKYGISAQDSVVARERLRALGQELGFTFNYAQDMRMVNTFRAHQLLDWAEPQGQQLPLKLALFKAYFTDGRDVSDDAVLTEVAASVGLDPVAAQAALNSGAHAAPVRQKQKFWTDRGIQGVPAVILGGKYLLTGAQGVDSYAAALEQVAAEAA